MTPACPPRIRWVSRGPSYLPMRLGDAPIQVVNGRRFTRPSSRLIGLPDSLLRQDLELRRNVELKLSWRFAFVAGARQGCRCRRLRAFSVSQRRSVESRRCREGVSREGDR